MAHLFIVVVYDSFNRSNVKISNTYNFPDFSFFMSQDDAHYHNHQNAPIPDVEGAAVGGDDDEEEAEEGEDYETDDEEIYWFDCPFCKNIWLREDLRDQHMMTCDQRV